MTKEKGEKQEIGETREKDKEKNEISHFLGGLKEGWEGKREGKEGEGKNEIPNFLGGMQEGEEEKRE